VVRTVLYVDDEAALCRAFERALRSPEMKVTTTTSPPEAVELMSTQAFDVIATDYRMPDINGIEILRTARERAPDARRLLVSGRIEGEVEESILRDADIDHIVIKPWTLDELRRVVRRAAEFAELARERTHLLAELALKERQVVAHRDHDVKLLHSALELRAPSTAVHSRRVAQIARALGLALDVGGEDLRILEEGALVHDIGKLALPDSLLEKAGPLTPDEWAEMSRHPAVGARFVERTDLAPGVAAIVRQHHERVDGNGYPLGLRDQEITLAARIVAVADAYETIHMGRSYRPGRSHGDTIAEIQASAGSQFDRAVVEALTRLGPAVIVAD
jgi:putative nucleotidyltransferase with HDIG domain